MKEMITKAQKMAVDLAIATNPTIVTIHRVEYVREGGGRKEVESDIDGQTVLLYPQSPDANKLRTDTGSIDESDWAILAPSDADFKWGAHVTDIVDAPNVGKLEVLSGRPLAVGDTINGYEIDLKLVK